MTTSNVPLVVVPLSTAPLLPCSIKSTTSIGIVPPLSSLETRSHTSTSPSVAPLVPVSAPPSASAKGETFGAHRSTSKGNKPHYGTTETELGRSKRLDWPDSSRPKILGEIFDSKEKEANRGKME
ncbi:O-methyltransferase family protein [Striga asiatica]|uniref:O-methyltransferase family protein n=1 Tax=Striga asiatica TaxID=4170 RepID=A0A5A7R0F3_STRAF|nr:O-methyltransferase family protein [Striga asiatica]